MIRKLNLIGKLTVNVPEVEVIWKNNSIYSIL